MYPFFTQHCNTHRTVLMPLDILSFKRKMTRKDYILAVLSKKYMVRASTTSSYKYIHIKKMILNNVLVKSADSTAKVSHNIMYLPMNQEIRTLVEIHNILKH